MAPAGPGLIVRTAEARVAGPHDRLRAVGDVQLAEDRGYVVGDGFGRQVEQPADVRVGQPGREMVQDVQLSLVRVGGPMASFADVLDARQEDAAGTWVFLLFVLGNIVGTFLLGLALWRSRSIARWAATAVMVWPPMHIVGLTAGVEWIEVAGTAVQGLGFAAVGARLLRRAIPRLVHHHPWRFRLSLCDTRPPPSPS